MVGIFPGAGGTTRLVRKLGAMAASPYLLEGKTLAPAKAKGAGIIDVVSDDPMSEAREFILNAKDADIVKPWDQKGYKMPGGTPYTPSGFHDLCWRICHGEWQNQGRLSCGQSPVKRGLRRGAGSL